MRDARVLNSKKYWIRCLCTVLHHCFAIGPEGMYALAPNYAASGMHDRLVHGHGIGLCHTSTVGINLGPSADLSVVFVHKTSYQQIDRMCCRHDGTHPQNRGIQTNLVPQQDAAPSVPLKTLSRLAYFLFFCARAVKGVRSDAGGGAASSEGGGGGGGGGEEAR